VRNQKLLFRLTIAALLTTGIVSWPTAAAAAGKSDPDKKGGIRTERAASPQMERTEAKLSPIALRLFGGYGQVEAGDVNEGLDGYFELLKLYSAVGAGTTTGGYTALRSGYDFGADLVFQITPRVGLGVGASWVRFSENSRITWSFEGRSEDADISSTPTLSAIPIRLGLFLTLPLGKKLNLTIGAGAEAYTALKLEARERLEGFASFEGDWVETTLSASRNAPLDNLGFQGSLGFELMILPNTGFFIEALGRYARFENFEKATISARNNEGASEANAGRIYLETRTFDGMSYSKFIVAETPPVSDSPGRVFTEPKIDLSGFSLRAGLRIRL
jgi:hypothetical protein